MPLIRTRLLSGIVFRSIPGVIRGMALRSRAEKCESTASANCFSLPAVLLNISLITSRGDVIEFMLFKTKFGAKINFKSCVNCKPRPRADQDQSLYTQKLVIPKENDHSSNIIHDPLLLCQPPLIGLIHQLPASLLDCLVLSHNINRLL